MSERASTRPAPSRPSGRPDGARDPRPTPLLRPTVGITRTIRSRSVPRTVQGQLALQWRLPGEVDAVPDPGPLLRRVSAQGGPDPDTDPAVAQVPTAGAALPDPGPWTAQLVQAVIEVLGHERPRQQLVRWLSPEVYADLSAHVLAAAPRGPGQRPRRTVSSIHLSEPADGVIEASAVVLGGRRARALALRLEGWDGRWRCTRLALL